MLCSLTNVYYTTSIQVYTGIDVIPEEVNTPAIILAHQDAKVTVKKCAGMWSTQQCLLSNLFEWVLNKILTNILTFIILNKRVIIYCKTLTLGLCS